MRTNVANFTVGFILTRNPRGTWMEIMTLRMSIHIPSWFTVGMCERVDAPLLILCPYVIVISVVSLLMFELWKFSCVDSDVNLQWPMGMELYNINSFSKNSSSWSPSSCTVSFCNGLADFLISNKYSLSAIVTFGFCFFGNLNIMPYNRFTRSLSGVNYRFTIIFVLSSLYRKTLARIKMNEISKK